MVAAYQDDFCTLYTGTALDVLREMPDQSVHMAVTSPPYWGLRSYLPAEHPAKGQELGTEKTPDEFVSKLVEVFGEVWRVLRDDGTLWVNIGDSYIGYWGDKKAKAEGRPSAADGKGFSMNSRPKFDEFRHTGLKPKDLCMIPARLAIALQSDGWYLRQELVWAKDSCMPESVRDRCTRAHEFVYMLTKRPRYFYDAEAIKETATGQNHHDLTGGRYSPPGQNGHTGSRAQADVSASRNARSVWRINPKPYPGSHFATFPPELPIRCIKAGTSERGVCSECGAPWRRVMGESYPVEGRGAGNGFKREHRLSVGGRGDEEPWTPKGRDTVGWEPTCTHDADTVPATVLDPFAGSGTTLYAARKLGRRSVAIDLDPKSADLLEDRLGHQGVLL